MDTPDFKEHFSSLLTESEEHLSRLDQFLVERLAQAEIDDPQTVIAGMDTTLDSIDRNHENPTTSRRSGTSRTVWCQQNLMVQTSSLKENQAATLLDFITGSMADGSSTTVDENSSFAGLDVVEKMHNLDQVLIENLSSTSRTSTVLNGPDDIIRESELLQRAIEGGKRSGARADPKECSSAMLRERRRLRMLESSSGTSIRPEFVHFLPGSQESKNGNEYFQKSNDMLNMEVKNDCF